MQTIKPLAMGLIAILMMPAGGQAAEPQFRAEDVIRHFAGVKAKPMTPAIRIGGTGSMTYKLNGLMKKRPMSVMPDGISLPKRTLRCPECQTKRR